MSFATIGKAREAFRSSQPGDQQQPELTAGASPLKSLYCLPAVGGCGTSTFVRHICALYPSVGSPVAVELGLYASLTERMIVVTSANVNGLDAVDSYLRWRLELNQDDPMMTLEGLSIAAIEDGQRGLRVEPRIRTGLGVLNQFVPVVVIPRVYRWRSKPGAPATKKYVKALHGVVQQQFGGDLP